MQTAHLNKLASQQFSLGSKASTISLWVPSTQLNCFELMPLTAPKKKWPEIIPWQLEDSLLESPDQYQIVWHQDNAKQPLNVFAIPKTELNQWQLMARANNVDALLMVPDCFALPVNPSGWAAYCEGDEVIVRTENVNGFACDKNLFWQLIERELQADDKFTVWFWTSTAQALPKEIQTNTRIEIEQRQISWDTVDPPKQYDLQGGMVRSQQPGVSGFTPWRWTAALAALLVVVSCIWMWLAGNYYQSSASQLTRIVQRDYQQLFGNQLNSAELAMDEGMRQQQLNKVQTRLFQQGAFAKLRDVDLALSSCNQCELTAFKVVDDELELRVSGPESLRNRFVSLNTRYDLNWQGSEDEYHLLTIKPKQAPVKPVAIQPAAIKPVVIKPRSAQ